MNKSPKFTPGRSEEVARHNNEQIQKALTLLEQFIRIRLKENSPGSIGLRIPLQKRNGELKLGNIRKLDETEQ